MKSIKLVYGKSDIISTIQNVSIAIDNKIQNVYLKSPLYNKCGVQVGNFCSNALIQQISSNNFMVRINSTYSLNGLGTINWQYNYIRADILTSFPVGMLIEGTIVSGTGKFLGARGKVKINPTADGTRYVVIKFD